MINVKSKRCLDCNKIPNFNLPDKKGGVYCAKHKKKDMIIVTNKRCKEVNCLIEANFNLPNEKSPIYCNAHKKENMVNVTYKKCLEENCDKHPGFNLPNKKGGIYCSEHKKENMVNVVSKTCLEEHCNIQPNFNLPNEKPIYCTKHKKENMIDVKHKTCNEKHCSQIPKNRNNKYNGYCLRCFIHKFPNEKQSINYKVKENHMTDFIKLEFKELVMVFDKQTGGCSKRRPDVYIDKFTHVVIIECDENQHKDTSCENMRTMELFQDFNNRPIVFIRFNPDSYVKDGKKFLSSFKMHKTLDVPVIRDKKEWNNRLDVLKETINKFLENIPEKEITNEFLFYDECVNQIL
jgi:hypothetical protein